MAAETNAVLLVYMDIEFTRIQALKKANKNRKLMAWVEHLISIVTEKQESYFHANVREDIPRKRVIGLYVTIYCCLIFCHNVLS